ncbi:MAG: cytochrome c nitrite reductase small subunit [Anaeromyxobacter sp.]
MKKTTRGMTLLSVPMALVAATAGLLLGLGAYAFHYAKGSSYLGNDPATCANCHVMQGHYQGWQAAVHHNVATCNDCHTPHTLVAKYVVKAINGYHHSMAFTLGNYPDVIRARPMSSAVVEANCRHCHADLVENVAHGGGVSCIRCHASVGHLK